MSIDRPTIEIHSQAKMLKNAGESFIALAHTIDARAQAKKKIAEA